MKEAFLSFIQEQKLVFQEEKILLTVSGGIDSMTMLHLFIECGFDIAIAHCNFGLRGSESDGDEEFVSRTAQDLRIPVHIKRFDTLNYADKHKLSIQMAARELRYAWFNRLAQENDYSKIASAHNANDVVETFFINLTRGTGLHGLTGINLINNKIIRPLLFATRKEIENYAEIQGIGFREDSSNAETKYVRNAIRHDIIPHFEQLNPSFLKNVIHTTSILKEAETIFNKHIEELKKLIISRQQGLLHIDISAMQAQNTTPALLFEIISPYGFSFDTAQRILENVSKQPGSMYFSESHKIVKDRTSYILYALNDNEQEEYSIEKTDSEFLGDIALKIKCFSADKNFVLKRNREVGTFDSEKLRFPLKLRRWKHGDYFYPFGMRGKKKISDYFSDQKISIPEKENTWLLCSGEDVIWIVNHRTDSRFCITNSTKEIVQIEVKH
jgi:tRNA(Ile)-lysidine synthase